jgi:CBS domain-containing protein
MHEPVTISPDDNLRVAANMMIRQHRHRLLVIDPGDPNAMPLGLISTSDIMHEMAQPGSAWQS